MKLRPVNPLVALVGAGVFAFLAGVGLMLFGMRQGPSSAFPERPLASAPRQLAPFTLRASDGRQASEKTLAGHWTLLFFGYTSCPDVCPTTLAELADLRRKLRESQVAPQPPLIVLVTVDPARDTPELLARYLAAFDADALGLSGDEAELERLAHSLGAYFARGAPDRGGHYAVDHSTAVYLIDPSLEVASVFLPPLSEEKLAKAMLGKR